MPMENCLICGICHGRGREFENQVGDCYLLIDHFVGRFVFESFYSDLNGVVVTALFCLVDHLRTKIIRPCPISTVLPATTCPARDRGRERRPARPVHSAASNP